MRYEHAWVVVASAKRVQAMWHESNGRTVEMVPSDLEGVFGLAEEGGWEMVAATSAETTVTLYFKRPKS